MLSIVGILLLVAILAVKKFNNYFFEERANHLEYLTEQKPINFDWVTDTTEGYFEPYLAIKIPVKIKGIPHKLAMQFDTGSPTTYLYENDLKSLEIAGLEYEELKIAKEHYVDKLEFSLGGNQTKAHQIKILKNYGHNFSKEDTISPIIIGTLGSDFMDNRITVIDYKNKNLQLFNERPLWMDTLKKFQPFDFSGRRFMLPCRIDGQELELLFDTGCSAFGLITSKYRFENYSLKEDIVIDVKSSRWGETLPIHHKSSKKTIELGNEVLNLKRISYVDMYADLQKYLTPFTKIGGFIGNRPFTECGIILDAKDESFLILK